VHDMQKPYRSAAAQVHELSVVVVGFKVWGGLMRAVGEDIAVLIRSSAEKGNFRSGGPHVGVPAFEDAQFGVQGLNESVRSSKKSGRRVLILA
jgi:hypothetical protein